MADPGTPGAPRSEAASAGVEPRGASPVEVLAAGPGRYDPGSGFDDLVRPLAVQEFLDTRYRDKRPVLFRGQGPRFASLCTWDDLNGLPSSGAWQGRMRLIRDGRQIPELCYTAPSPALDGERAPNSRLDERRSVGGRRKGPRCSGIVMARVWDAWPEP